MMDQPSPTHQALSANQELAADQELAEIAAQEWLFRRRHVLRELGAYVPLRAELPAVDPRSQDEKLAFWGDVLARLDGLDVDALSPVGREDFGVLRQQVKALHAAQRYRDYQRPFNGFVSFWDNTAAVIREENFDCDSKYRDVLSMMNDIPRYFSENIDNLRAGLDRGFSQPGIILPAAIRTIEAVLAQAPQDSDYFKPFRTFPAQIPADRQAALRLEALSVIHARVRPAFAELLDFMRAHYAVHATTRIAATDLPNGAAYYDSKVREFTTLEMPPQEIFQTGLREVEICRQQMIAAMHDSGFSGSLPEFLAFLKTDPQFYAGSEDELLMRAAWVTKKVEARLHRFFGLLPRQRFAIEPVPASIAPTYPMGTGAPGLYSLNTHNLSTRPLYLLPVLTLHEAVPGHCFQMSLAAENHSRPPFRSQTYGIAYGNAWALYCEKRLGVEMGIYQTPFELFGAWSLLTLRAVRMVVDVGVHANNWDYQRALAYMIDNTGLPRPVVEAELNRYISWPGQALGYYLGMMAIERARAKAEQALGSDFDIRAFHDRILALGPVPMTVVEASIDQMIAMQTSKTGRTAFRHNGE